MYNSDMEKIMRKYKRKLTRKNAIRIYCKEHCSAGDQKSWKECSFYACPLFNFRLGRESLAKPQSFKKQRKTTTNLDKQGVSQELSK